MNDIELYLTCLNINNDQADQEVNDYPIHKILQIDNLSNLLDDQFQQTWEYYYNFWNILSKEELNKNELEKNVKNITKQTKRFNTTFLKL